MTKRAKKPAMKLSKDAPIITAKAMILPSSAEPPSLDVLFPLIDLDRAVDVVARHYAAILPPSPRPEEAMIRTRRWKRKWPAPWDRMTLWFETPDGMARFLGASAQSLGRWADGKPIDLEYRVRALALARLLGVETELRNFMSRAPSR